MTELGPFNLNDDSMATEAYNKTGIPTLFKNPYSWNKVGSILMFDAPSPVGYSYCNNNPAGDGYSCGDWDDNASTWNNYYAMLAFYDKFPSLLSRPLYLTGESYAGVYIPSLARKILENRHQAPKANAKDDPPSNLRSTTATTTARPNSFPLKGFAVGDGCVGLDVNCFGDQPKWFDLKFFAGHGQISLKMEDAVVSVCGEETLKARGKPLEGDCKAIFDEALASVGGFYEYSLYDECTYDNGILKKSYNEGW